MKDIIIERTKRARNDGQGIVEVAEHLRLADIELWLELVEAEIDQMRDDDLLAGDLGSVAYLDMYREQLLALMKEFYAFEIWSRRLSTYFDSGDTEGDPYVQGYADGFLGVKYPDFK